MKRRFQILSLISIAILLLSVFSIAYAAHSDIDFLNLNELTRRLFFEAYDRVKVSEAWHFLNQRSASSSLVIIGIVDTGFDSSHPEFADIDFGNTPLAAKTDDEVPSHGTNVVGIIGANNISRISSTDYISPHMNGVVSGVQNLEYRLEVRKIGLKTIFNLLGGISDVTSNGAKVVNISATSFNLFSDLIFRSTFTNNSDVLFVVAAGNGNVNAELAFPASLGDNLDNVVTVGATTLNDERAAFSNFGDAVNLVAPGESVWSPTFFTLPLDAGDYEGFGGTSASAPLVTGVAGLLKAIDDDLTPAQIKNILIETGDSIQTDKPIGPRLNAFEAVKRVLPPAGPSSYDFASDFVSIDGNVSSIPGCTSNRQGQSVSFFDDFNDGSVSTGCTVNFFQIGTFEEANSLLQMKSGNGVVSGDSTVHFLQFSRFFQDASGFFEVLTHFRPDPVQPPPNFTLYGIFLVEPFASRPGLSVQTSAAPDGRTFLVAGNNLTQQFTAQPLDMGTPQNLVVKVQFDDSTNAITPLFSFDNGQTFQPWLLGGNPFSTTFFTQDSRAGFILTSQARIPASSLIQTLSSPVLVPVQVSGTNEVVTLPLVHDTPLQIP